MDDQDNSDETYKDPMEDCMEFVAKEVGNCITKINEGNHQMLQMETTLTSIKESMLTIVNSNKQVEGRLNELENKLSVVSEEVKKDGASSKSKVIEIRKQQRVQEQETQKCQNKIDGVEVVVNGLRNKTHNDIIEMFRKYTKGGMDKLVGASEQDDTNNNQIYVFSQGAVNEEEIQQTSSCQDLINKMTIYGRDTEQSLQGLGFVELLEKSSTIDTTSHATQETSEQTNISDLETMAAVQPVTSEPHTTQQTLEQANISPLETVSAVQLKASEPQFKTFKDLPRAWFDKLIKYKKNQTMAVTDLLNPVQRAFVKWFVHTQVKEERISVIAEKIIRLGSENHFFDSSLKIQDKSLISYLKDRVKYEVKIIKKQPSMAERTAKYVHVH